MDRFEFGSRVCLFSPSHSLLSLCAVRVQLFEDVSRENSQLQCQLQDSQRVVTQTRVDLDKATQVTHGLTSLATHSNKSNHVFRMRNERGLTQTFTPHNFRHHFDI